MRTWRGWGALPFFVIAALAGITALLAQVSGTNMNGITWQGLPAFFIIGAGLYFWGRHLNVTGPAKKLATQIAQHSAEDRETALTSSPINPMQPVFTEAEGAVLKRMQNRYTMLFFPIQWWGVALPIFGLVITVANLFSAN